MSNPYMSTKADDRAYLASLTAGLLPTVTKCKPQAYRGDRVLHKRSAGAAPGSVLDTARLGRRSVGAMKIWISDANLRSAL